MDKKTRPKVCEKKLKGAEIKLLKIMQKMDHLKLSDFYISRLHIGGNREGKGVIFNGFSVKRIGLAVVAVVSILYWGYSAISNERCFLINPSISKSIFRPPEDCAMCAAVREATRLSNVSAREFERFAYGARPLIVTDGAAGWRAMTEFNYDFFKKFYSSGGKMGTQTNDCFYFAYKSGLNSLQEVFSMPESRANLSGEPWYVGWSSCFEEETRRLRAYYKRPYFLPPTAESDMVDWIFMGGPGQGAHMHVDSVKHMSWQAQIRGRKEWQLAPPPECFYSCHWFSFNVAPGEILVVDTNRWYHKTNVLPGDISITIGAEYD